MGFSLEWLAVKNGARDSVIAPLGLRATGQREEIPESDLTGTSLPGGWYMIVSNHGSPALMEEKMLARASAQSEVVCCFVEEHCMCSSAQGWRNGSQTWSVFHEAATGGISHLETKGDLPAVFNAIRDRQYAKQEAAGGSKAGVDYIFDIPVELAHELTGYRHDVAIPELGDRAFEVLTATEAGPRPSWLRKALGI
jgi:hypothetical protein